MKSFTALAPLLASLAYLATTHLFVALLFAFLACGCFVAPEIRRMFAARQETERTKYRVMGAVLQGGKLPGLWLEQRPQLGQ